VIAHRDQAESGRAEAGHLADVCPRSNRIYFRSLGLIARLDDLDHNDREPG
jgi:hypothetical protein